jgi:hypothetical protein
MTRVVKVVFCFAGESFAGTLRIPNYYIRPDGSINKGQLFNRLSAHPNITIPPEEFDAQEEPKHV